jgi:hypothetical protein
MKFFRINRFVLLEQTMSVRDFPDEHVILYPDRQPFLDEFTEVRTKSKEFAYYKGIACSSQHGFQLLEEPRAVRCIGSGKSAFTVSIPYLTSEQKLCFPGSNQHQYVFDSFNKNAFPLPKEFSGHVVVQTDFIDQARIKVQFDKGLEVFSHYTHEKDQTNRFDIWIQQHGREKKVPLNICTFSFHSSAPQYLPEAKIGKDSKNIAARTYRLTANPESNFTGLLLDHSLLNQEITLKKSVLQLSGKPDQSCISGYFNEFYRLEGGLSPGHLQDLRDYTYEQLTREIGIERDEHLILGDQKLFSRDNFIEKVPGLALGIMPKDGKNLLSRLAENQLIYTDTECTLLWGNLILKMGRA